MRPRHLRSFIESRRAAHAADANHPPFVSLLKLPLLITAAMLAFFAAFLSAQAYGEHPVMSAVPARVQTPVDDSVLFPTRGNIYPSAQPRFDEGPAASGTHVEKLRLLLNRGLEQNEKLRKFLDGVQDPHSPRYHKWLTPQEYGASFGLADGDLEQVKAWLGRAGLKVEGVPAGRNFVEFSGTVGQVERAFHTGIHSYSVGGTRHYSNTLDPQIPAALAPVISGISPLNDFRAGAQASVVGMPQNRQGVERRVIGATAKPAFINATDRTLYITPADAATLYNSPNKLNKNFKSGTERTGAGVTIGIAGYSDLAVDDYLNYRRLFLQETTPVQPTLVFDGVDPGVEYQHDGQITLIDTEIAAALAPGAQIYVYSSKSDLLDDGLIDAIARAIEDNAVSILSVSYARCEYALGASGNAAIGELWQQAAAQGISVVVAAGDTGSAACDDGNEAAAKGGLAVNGLASTPYNLAVGGTDLDALAQGFAHYADLGIGSSDAATASVNGYIPESPWNNAITNNPPATAATNIAGTYDFGQGSTTLILAGGGGISSLGFCSGGYDETGNCNSFSGYPTPSFQSGLAPNAPADVPPAARFLPDISLFAGDGRQYPVVWAICSDHLVAQANYTFTDCQPGSDGSFSVEGGGGTGAAASAAAGMLAMLSESLGGIRLGIVNNTLYNLYAGNVRSTVFHDISVGNNAVPCTASSPNCSGNEFLTGYDAAPGYDLSTGMGSVDISALIAAWPSASFEATGISLLVDSGSTPVTITHGDPVNLAVAVVPVALPGTTASGSASVTAIADPSAPGKLYNPVNEQVTLANGQGSTTTQKLPGGTYDLQAYYPGDATHSASTSSVVEIEVRPEPSALQLFLKVTDINDSHAYQGTFPYGSFGFAYVQPTSVSGEFHGPATGQVNLLNNGTTFSALDSPSGQPLNSAGRAAFPLAHVVPGTYQLSATYAGDSSYKPSTTVNSAAITITKGPTTLTVSPASTSLAASTTEIVTATLMTDSTGDYPSGGVTLSANGMSFPGTVREVFTKINSVEEVWTFQVRGAALASGSNTLTVTYPGDTKYDESSATAAITVTGTPGGAFTLTGPAGGIAVTTGQAQSSGTVAVGSIDGFEGVVKLSCALNPAIETAFYECAVTPSVALPAGTSANATVTISTTGALAEIGGQTKAVRPGPMQLRLGEAGLVLCSGLLFLIPVRRRVGLLVVTAAALLGTLGCGVQITRVKNFSAVVTGTSGGTTVTLEIPIKIQ